MTKTFLLPLNNIFWKKFLWKGNFSKQITKKVFKKKMSKHVSKNVFKNISQKFSENQISTVAALPRTKAEKVLVYLISGTFFFGGVTMRVFMVLKR